MLPSQETGRPASMYLLFQKGKQLRSTVRNKQLRSATHKQVLFPFLISLFSFEFHFCFHSTIFLDVMSCNTLEIYGRFGDSLITQYLQNKRRYIIYTVQQSVSTSITVILEAPPFTQSIALCFIFAQPTQTCKR